MTISVLKHIAIVVSVIALARALTVLAFTAFFSERSFVHDLNEGILFGRLFGPGGWAITLVAAGFVGLLWHLVTARRHGSLRDAIVRIAPVAGLLVLTPWVGEYLLGNVPLTELPALPLLTPLYGGGALLIRELTRRTDRGYPAILLLGMAYGVIEAGLVDQSLFNPDFEGHAFHATTVIPFLGIGAHDAIAFIGGHAIWSIAVPIALIELLTPKRRTMPWLGVKGLAATALFYFFGCWFIFQHLLETEQFLATSLERLGALTVALTLVGAAFAFKNLSPVSSQLVAPEPWVVGVSVFALINAFFMRSESWFGVALGVAVLGVVAWLLIRWSSRQGWGVWHQWAVVAATLPTYIYAGFILTLFLRPDNVLAWVGNVIFACIAVALLVVAAWRIRQTG